MCALADALGVHRASVYRWRKDDWGLDDLFDEEQAKLLAAGANGKTPALNQSAALLQELTRQQELETYLTLPAYPQLVD